MACYEQHEVRRVASIRYKDQTNPHRDHIYETKAITTPLVIGSAPLVTGLNALGNDQILMNCSMNKGPRDLDPLEILDCEWRR